MTLISQLNLGAIFFCTICIKSSIKVILGLLGKNPATQVLTYTSGVSVQNTNFSLQRGNFRQIKLV